jgi:general secretion pathway protein D
MLESAQRQVLIQATIVEVALSDQYQAGIDWSGLNIAETGINIISTTLNPAFPATPFDTLTQLTLDYTDTDAEGNIRTTTLIRLLEEFGETRVLSSPQIMVLNNQTAVLKVVENVVYFLIESELTPATVPGGAPVTSVDTTPQTVPVGIVMAVTPQINEANVVTLNVRPTISRVNDFITDPNPNVAPGVVNRVPQIEVREMESMLRLNSGQVAVLGGLMQDIRRDDDSRIPGFSRLPVLGDLFRTKTKDYQKSELVIFLRPVVIRNPSIAADLSDYRSFLERGAAPYAAPPAPQTGQTPDTAGASGQ